MSIDDASPWEWDALKHKFHHDEYLPESESSQPSMQRFNEGKPPLSYILELDRASKGVSRVLEYGAVKYDRNNYKNGGDMAAKEFLLDSMLRHAMAYMNGEDLDEESGLPHVYHMACSAMFAAYHYNGEGAEE